MREGGIVGRYGASQWIPSKQQGGDVEAGLAELEAPGKSMIDDLLWWSAALKVARATAPTTAGYVAMPSSGCSIRSCRVPEAAIRNGALVAVGYFDLTASGSKLNASSKPQSTRGAPLCIEYDIGP
jgi:hypothetical protein